MKEDCKGCRNIRVEGMGCVFKLRNSIDLCPCRECLVKVTCQEFCDERNGERISVLRNQYN